MMNLTEVFITLITAVSEAFGFCGVLHSMYAAISKEKFSFLPFYVTVLAVNAATGFIAVTYQPITMLITAVIYLQLKKSKFIHTVISCISALIIFSLLMTILSTIVMLFVPVDMTPTMRHEILYNICCALLFFVLSLFAIGIVNFISHHTEKMDFTQYSKYVKGDKKLIYFIAIAVVVMVTILSTVWYFSLTDFTNVEQYVALGLALEVTMAFFTAFSVYTVMRIITQNANEMEIQKNKELTEVYKTEIQSMYDEIRDFKHDYMKIYSSMSVLLKENKIDELKDFFDREITPLQSNIMQESSIGPALTLIDDSIVQGVIYNYVIKAKNGGIDFHIDVHDKIPASEKISSLELSRILGIILDNAFEEAVKTKAKEVQFGIVSGVGTVYVVKNTYSETPDLSKIFDKSYSTKGTERGRGLAIVKGICDKYEEIDLNVKIQPNYFVCELMI